MHDYPESENRAQGEALAEGTCAFLGHAFRPPQGPDAKPVSPPGPDAKPAPPPGPDAKSQPAGMPR